MKNILSCIIGIGVAFLSYAQELGKNEISELTGKIPKLILEHYVLVEKKEGIANTFLERIQSAKYLGVNHPDSLVKLLTNDLRAISNDKHLYVEQVKSAGGGKEFDRESWSQKEKALEQQQNFGFTEVKILDGNIGYLKIVEFMHPKRGLQTAVAVMKFLENTQSLIVDLRGNGGGYSGLMRYMLNHYFDGGPTHISTTFYSDKNAIPNKDYSSDLVYGKLRVGTPLYILTDSKTGSAAEFFAYTLQAFDKAVVVGEATAGAAHMNSFYPLSKNFRISISTAAPINPITNENWELKGVQPDYETTSGKAFQKTLELLNEKADAKNK